MAEGPIGEFWHRFPENLELHENKAGEPLFLLPCHEHTFGHVRFLYASDAPGPDGRVGWWEMAWSPIINEAREVIGWHEERNHHVRGNGPDSARWIPAGWRHEFSLLSMTGYHQCFFHNREPDTHEITPAITGWPGATH